MTTAIRSKPADQPTNNALGFPVTSLSHFHDTTVVAITLTPGSWVVFGKVVIVNEDGDYQFVRAKLVAQNLAEHGPLVIDETSVYMRGADVGDGGGVGNLGNVKGYPQSFSLQAPFFVGIVETFAPINIDGFVRIDCSTLNGLAWGAQLVAISVDDLQSSTGLPPGGLPQEDLGST